MDLPRISNAACCEPTPRRSPKRAYFHACLPAEGRAGVGADAQHRGTLDDCPCSSSATAFSKSPPALLLPRWLPSVVPRLGSGRTSEAWREAAMTAAPVVSRPPSTWPQPPNAATRWQGTSSGSSGTCIHQGPAFNTPALHSFAIPRSPLNLLQPAHLAQHEDHSSSVGLPTSPHPHIPTSRDVVWEHCQLRRHCRGQSKKPFSPPERFSPGSPCDVCLKKPMPSKFKPGSACGLGGPNRFALVHSWKSAMHHGRPPERDVQAFLQLPQKQVLGLSNDYVRTSADSYGCYLRKE